MSGASPIILIDISGDSIVALIVKNAKFHIQTQFVNLTQH